MPMQPNPSADTSRPLFPSCRLFIVGHVPPDSEYRLIAFVRTRAARRLGVYLCSKPRDSGTGRMSRPGSGRHSRSAGPGFRTTRPAGGTRAFGGVCTTQVGDSSQRRFRLSSKPFVCSRGHSAVAPERRLRSRQPSRPRGRQTDSWTAVSRKVHVRRGGRC
jgi:hypothetical protein